MASKTVRQFLRLPGPLPNDFGILGQQVDDTTNYVTMGDIICSVVCSGAGGLVAPHAATHADGQPDAVTVTHAQTTGKTADDHHAQVHAADHLLGAADPIDGDGLGISYTPSNYTPADGTLCGHLSGIDAAVTGGGGTPVVSDQAWVVHFDDFFCIPTTTATQNEPTPYRKYKGGNNPVLAWEAAEKNGVMSAGTGNGQAYEWGMLEKSSTRFDATSADVYMEARVRVVNRDGSNNVARVGFFNAVTSTNMGGTTGGWYAEYDQSVDAFWAMGVNGTRLQTSTQSAPGNWVKIKIKFNQAGTPEWWINDVKQTNPGVGTGSNGKNCWGLQFNSNGSTGIEFEVDYVKLWTAR